MAVHMALREYIQKFIGFVCGWFRVLGSKYL